MEIILTILLVVGIGIYFKLQDKRVSDYINSNMGNIDYGKINNDRIMNDLSNSQVNHNILSGKYNKK